MSGTIRAALGTNRTSPWDESTPSPGQMAVFFLDSQVPKRVVSKRVVLADVPLYRHFIFFTFWFFYVLAVRRCLPPQRGGDPDQVFSLN